MRECEVCATSRTVIREAHGKGVLTLAIGNGIRTDGEWGGSTPPRAVTLGCAVTRQIYALMTVANPLVLEQALHTSPDATSGTLLAHKYIS